MLQVKTESPRYVPPATLRGKSLDDTPFDLDTFDLDELLATASAEHSADDVSDTELNDFDLCDCDLFQEDFGTTLAPDAAKEAEDPSFFISIFSMFRSSSNTLESTESMESTESTESTGMDSAPTTPPTQTKTSSNRNNQNDAGFAAAASSSSSSTTVPVDEKKIEARLASQRYRNTKLQEYQNLQTRNKELLTLNMSLRNDISVAGERIALKPPPLDLTTVPGCVNTTNWTRAETRKERNRLAAKRSRDAAKRKHTVLKAQNNYLEKDIHALTLKLQELHGQIKTGNQVHDKKRTTSDTENGAMQPVSKRSKMSQHSSPSSFLLGESSLLLSLCICAVLGAAFQWHDNKEDGANVENAGMDLGAGLLQHMALDANNPLPLVGAGIVCIFSTMMFVVFSYQSEKERT